MKKIIYVGLDVHKDSVNAAVLTNQGEILCEKKMVHHWPKIKQFFLSVQKKNLTSNIEICYEAGPTGYGLARSINELDGFNCRIVAPGKLPKRTDKIKTDRRDALSLAKNLIYKEVTEVIIPDEVDEQNRELIRFRKARKRDLKRIKQELKAFLLRNGYKYEGKTAWSKTHVEWIRKLNLGSSVLSQIRDRYMGELLHLTEVVTTLEKEITELGKDSRYKDSVEKMTLLRGVGQLTALSFCTEIGDFKRFPNAKSFMCFLGLVPSEFSSGSKIVKGSITRQGNSELRRLLIEAAWQYFLPYQRRPITANGGADRQEVIYAEKALDRLRQKKRRMADIAGKNNKKVATAIARELAGFIWGMMNSKY